jgi:hypothetical protein
MVKDDAGCYDLEAMPLDFVVLKESHTGFYLADTVRLIVEKFGLQNKARKTDSLRHTSIFCVTDFAILCHRYVVLSLTMPPITRA